MFDSIADALFALLCLGAAAVTFVLSVTAVGVFMWDVGAGAALTGEVYAAVAFYLGLAAASAAFLISPFFAEEL